MRKAFKYIRWIVTMSIVLTWILIRATWWAIASPEIRKQMWKDLKLLAGIVRDTAYALIGYEPQSKWTDNHNN